MEKEIIENINVTKKSTNLKSHIKYKIMILKKMNEIILIIGPIIFKSNFIKFVFVAKGNCSFVLLPKAIVFKIF